MASLVLQLLVLNLECDYAFRVIQSFLNRLLKLFLRLFELIFVISGLFFVNLLVFLSFFKFGLSLRELFLSLLQAFFQVIF